MSDIFFSQVNKNLQAELNARGKAGFHSRTNKDLDYMLGKVANIEIIPYKSEIRAANNEIRGGRLGGKSVLQGEFLPSTENGFMRDRTTKVQTNNIDPITGAPKESNTERINSSRRIPPFITSMDVSIGDHAQGLLNSANIQFIIPNPQQDLNFIESVYFRPGRHVTVILQHPESAIITRDENEGLLDQEDTMPSADKLQKLYPGRTDFNAFRKMNTVSFDGQIISFNLTYQADMSVQAQISLKGASATYTDVSLLANTSEPDKDDKPKKIVPKKPKRKAKGSDLISGSAGVFGTAPSAAQLANNVLYIDINGNAIKEGTPINADGTKHIPPPPPPAKRKLQKSFYTKFEEEYEFLIISSKNKQSWTELEQDDYYTANGVVTKNVEYHAIWGQPYNNSKYLRYVNLEWIIDFINRTVIDKTGDPKATIICTSKDSFTKSRWLSELRSVDPTNVIIDLGHTYTNNSNGLNKGFLLQFFGLHQKDDKKLSEPNPGFYDDDLRSLIGSSPGPAGSTSGTEYLTGRILFGLHTLKEIINSLSKQDKLKTNGPANVLKLISSYIKNASVGTIDLKLITHPDQRHQDKLLFYDSKNLITTNNTTKRTIPYSVPMFANHPNGSVAREFSFTGKLPSDVSNLSYVLNQNSNEISESDIAPFLSYMYATNTVERTIENGQLVETTGTLLSPEILEEQKSKHKDRYEIAYNAWQGVQEEFAGDPASKQTLIALKAAAKKHNKYPIPELGVLNNIASPTIPFTVEFTIDGINGFRYGDVLTFDGLPDRYKKGGVFIIMNINHTVNTSGEWTTKIRTVMKVKVS